jgi:hypothetical protein
MREREEEDDEYDASSRADCCSYIFAIEIGITTEGAT